MLHSGVCDILQCAGLVHDIGNPPFGHFGETIIKYPVSSLAINKESGNIKDKKMGYYYAERDIFADLQETLGTNGARHPLAYVLEAADDIAYKTADIEDAFKKGCITYGQLVQELNSLAKSENGEDEGADIEYGRLVAALEDRYKKLQTENGRYI